MYVIHLIVLLNILFFMIDNKRFVLYCIVLYKEKKNELWGRQFDSKGMGGWQIFKGQKKKFRQYHLF